MLEPLQHVFEDPVGKRVELVRLEQLDWVLDEQHVEIGHAEQPSLFERFVGERDGADPGGRDASPF